VAFSSVSVKDSEWMVIDLVIKALTPIVIPERTLGNVVLSREGIPGTHLLGPITRALNRLGINSLPHVAVGDLQILFAWPEVEGARGLPVPFAVFYEKEKGGLDKGNKVWNRFREDVADVAQLKNHREGFVGPNKPNTLPALDKLAMDMRTHNTVDDELQRPTAEVGGVYTYQAIPAGTILRSEIRLRHSLAETLANKCSDWWHSLEGQHRIGRAKKDDYGVVEIRCKSEPKALEIDMKDRLKLNQETEVQRDLYSLDIASGKSELTVWLLSDLLIRDERLRFTAQPEELGRVLKEELKVNGDAPKFTLRRHGQLLSFLARVRRTESWHVGWGQPRPSLVGLAAGSCFMFDVEGTLDPKALVRLEREGLGERRAEGYGQIMFNSPLIGQEISKWQPSSKSQQGSGSDPAAKLIHPNNCSEVFAYARLLEQGAWRREIQRRAQWLGADTQNRRKRFVWTERKPTNTQLSTLRGVVASLRESNTVHRKRVTDWLNEVKAREKWDQDPITRVGSLITQDEVIWQWLEWPSLPVLTEGGEAELKTRLWPEAVRVVVNAAVKGETRDRERQ
jgi:CRISPR-associated protein Csx10